MLDVQLLSKESPSVPLRVQLDSGATCSVMSIDDYRRITGSSPPPSSSSLKLYEGHLLQPIGADVLRCSKSGISKKIQFKIVDTAPTSLLSSKASEALRLMSFNTDQLVNAIQDETTLTQEQVLNQYKDVFTGIGKLPGHYHIEMNQDTTPVQHTRRRVTVPVRGELKAKISEMEQQGVLAKVTEHTPWLSSMVVVRKPGKLRICLDHMDLNKGIKRNHHPIPTIEKK